MRTPPFFALLLYLFVPCLGKIAITNLSVPGFVQNGTDPTVLIDCEYKFDPELDDMLVLKWFLDDDPEPVYQWIPKLGSRTVSEILQPFLDMQYTAPDPDTKYRALRLRKPTVEVGGLYTCSVGSLYSHDTKQASMIIYAPARKMELSYNKLSPDTIAINCEADEVYPEPKLRLYFDLEDSAIMDTDEDSVNGESESTSLSRGNSTSMSMSDDQGQKAATKDETSEGGYSKPDSLATNSATVSEDGSEETDENTNSEKSAEEDETSEGGYSKPDSLATNSATISEDGSKETNENTDSEKSAEFNKVNATSGKSVGTSESVGPDKSEGTSESMEIIKILETTEKEDDTSEESEEIPSKKVISVKKGKMYRVRIRSEIKLKRMDKEAEFECILEIPGTNHIQKQKILYRPAISSPSVETEMESLEDDPETSTLMSQEPKKHKSASNVPAIAGSAIVMSLLAFLVR